MWKDLLVEPIAGDHFVQLYKAEDQLIAAICLFAGQGLGRGHGVVLVVTPAHREAIERCLREQDFAVEGLQRLGQLTLLDAESLLARVMRQGLPDRELFRREIAAVLRSVRAPGRRLRVRVFGEMVDLLWRRANLPAAARLESLWNEAVATHALALFCAYGLNGEGPDGFPSALRELHSHVLPAGNAPSA